MTDRLPISNEDRTEADRRIDEHFDFVRYVIEHPECLDAFEDGTELHMGRILPSAVRVTITGNTMDGLRVTP